MQIVINETEIKVAIAEYLRRRANGAHFFVELFYDDDEGPKLFATGVRVHEYDLDSLVALDRDGELEDVFSYPPDEKAVEKALGDCGEGD